MFDVSDLPTPPWKPAGRAKQPAKVPLSLDRIVEAALAIVDAEGTEAVTMRRVAGDLGTGAASLYAYVSSREDLLRLVHERVISTLEFPDFADLPWADGVREFTDRVYEIYAAHSDISLYGYADVPTHPTALRGAEGLLSAMLRDGVPVQVAAWSLDRLSMYVAADAYEGWLMRKRFGGATQAEAEQRGREFFDQVGGFFASLPPDVYPTIVGNVDALMSGEGQDRFRFGVDMFVAGIRSTIPDAD